MSNDCREIDKNTTTNWSKSFFVYIYMMTWSNIQCEWFLVKLLLLIITLLSFKKKKSKGNWEMSKWNSIGWQSFLYARVDCSLFWNSNESNGWHYHLYQLEYYYATPSFSIIFYSDSWRPFTSFQSLFVDIPMHFAFR